jgi:hypothetical protein
MLSVLDAGVGEIVLRKPSWRSGGYELVTPRGIVGRLDTSPWSGGSIASAADGRWNFDRPRGVLQRRVRITTGPDERELAVFRRDGWLRGGAIDLGDDSFRLAVSGWWKPRWEWSQEGVALLTFTTRESFGPDKGRLQFTPDGRRCRHASLLALLGVHLSILARRESSAASGSAVIAGGAVASG